MFAWLDTGLFLKLQNQMVGLMILFNLMRKEEQTEAKLEALLKKSTLVISLHDINLFEEK